MPGVLPGGGAWAVLDLTGTLCDSCDFFASPLIK